MDTDAIRKVLTTAAEEENFSKRLTKFLIQLIDLATQSGAEGSQPYKEAFASHLLSFADSYVHLSLNAINRLQANGVSQPIIESIEGIWSQSPLFLPEGLGALSFADKSYYTLTLLERLNDRLLDRPRSPVAEDRESFLNGLSETNTSMRWMLGEGLTGRLENLVEADLSEEVVNEVLETMAVAASWELGTPLPTLEQLVPAILEAISRFFEMPEELLVEGVANLPRSLDVLIFQQVDQAAPDRTTFDRGNAALQSLFPSLWSRDAHLYRVWYGTTRKPTDSINLSRGFSNERDPSGQVHYGYCEVSVPKTHNFGEMGTPWWKRWLKLQFADDHLRVASRKAIANAAAFTTALCAELAGLEENDRQILVHLHGYKTTFDEAAIQAAQLGFDLKVPGATAFFSWPSMATYEGYFSDVESIGASEMQIADFLTMLVQETRAKMVHIIAHSMGNRGLARAIQRIAGQTTESTGVRFGQIILAAADIEVNLFRSLAALYPEISLRTTLYVSRKDLALELSKWIQNADRAGYLPPVTVVPGIDTIEVTDIDLTLIGHGYFSNAEPVLYDMFDLLRKDSSPRDRIRLKPRPEINPEYWYIER